MGGSQVNKNCDLNFIPTAREELAIKLSENIFSLSLNVQDSEPISYY